MRALSLYKFLLFFIFNSFLLIANPSLEQTESLEEFFLPENHPLQWRIQKLFKHPEMFNNALSLEQAGFKMEWNVFAANATTILVASHPRLGKYLIKKYPNSDRQATHLKKYMRRILGARKIEKYIEECQLKHIVVPKKWLYRLPPAFKDPKTGDPDYLLFVEKMEICDGGWWGGETLERYHKISKPVLQELCYLLHDLQGCDAWPQNQPFTPSGQIAFIDTDHVGLYYGDFIERTIKFIDPNLVDYAIKLWQKRQTEVVFNL